MKAGFEHIADFMMAGTVSGAGKPHHLLIKRFQPIVQSDKVTPNIQNGKAVR